MKIFFLQCTCSSNRRIYHLVKEIFFIYIVMITTSKVMQVRIVYSMISIYCSKRKGPTIFIAHLLDLTLTYLSWEVWQFHRFCNSNQFKSQSFLIKSNQFTSHHNAKIDQFKSPEVTIQINSSFIFTQFWEWNSRLLIAALLW